MSNRETGQAVAAAFHLIRSLAKDDSRRREKYGTDRVLKAIEKRSKMTGGHEEPPA